MMVQFITEMLAILCWGVGYHSYNVFCGLINSCHIPAVCARVDAYALLSQTQITTLLMLIVM